MCRPIRFVIILVIKQIGLPLRGRPILLINRMITNRIGLHSVLLSLLRVLYEGTSSQLYTQFMQLRKESLKKNSGLYEISFRNCISCVYNCDDLPSNNSSLRSSHIWISHIHNFNNYSVKTAAGLTQSGRKRDCRAEGRGFDSWGRTKYPGSQNNQLKQLRNEGTSFAQQMAGPSRGLDDHVKWWFRLQ